MAAPNRSTLIHFLGSDRPSEPRSALAHFKISHAICVEKARTALKEALPKGLEVGDDLVFVPGRGLAVEVRFKDGSSDDLYAIDSVLSAHAKGLFGDAAKIAANAEDEAPKAVEKIIPNKKELALLAAFSTCGKEGLRPTIQTPEADIEYPLPDPGHLNISVPQTVEEATIRGTLTGIRVRANGVQLETESRYWIGSRIDLATAVAYLLRQAKVSGKISRRSGADAWDIFGELEFSPEQEPLMLRR